MWACKTHAFIYKTSLFPLNLMLLSSDLLTAPVLSIIKVGTYIMVFLVFFQGSPVSPGIAQDRERKGQVSF